jgi:hypothetical protein
MRRSKAASSSTTAWCISSKAGMLTRDVKTPPLVWIRREIVRRMARGEFPLLSDKAVVESNTNGGLNLVGWNAVVIDEGGKRVDLNFLFRSVVEVHGGFRIRSSTSGTTAYNAIGT